MFTVNIMLRTTPNPFVLYFKSQEAASRIYDSIFDDVTAEVAKKETISVRDESGQWLNIASDVFAGAFMTDAEQMGEVQINMSLIQARAQAAAQVRAQGDPSLRVASMANGSNNPGGFRI